MPAYFGNLSVAGVARDELSDLRLGLDRKLANHEPKPSIAGIHGPTAATVGTVAALASEVATLDALAAGLNGSQDPRAGDCAVAVLAESARLAAASALISGASAELERLTLAHIAATETWAAAVAARDVGTDDGETALALASAVEVAAAARRLTYHAAAAAVVAVPGPAPTLGASFVRARERTSELADASRPTFTYQALALAERQAAELSSEAKTIALAYEVAAAARLPVAAAARFVAAAAFRAGIGPA